MQQSIQNTGTGASGQPVSGVAGNAVNNAANLLLQNMFSTGDVISGKVTSLQGNVVELLLPGGLLEVITKVDRSLVWCRMEPDMGCRLYQ